MFDSKDKYGNTEDEFINCSYPDCGCDGARNCMALSGANNASFALNLEKGDVERWGKAERER